MGKLHDPRKLSETVIGELAQQIFIQEKQFIGTYLQEGEKVSNRKKQRVRFQSVIIVFRTFFSLNKFARSNASDLNKILLQHECESTIYNRGVFRTLSNIYNGALLAKIVNSFKQLFCENAPAQMFDRVINTSLYQTQHSQQLL